LVVEESKSDPGFLERGGLRRRLRFLRKTRELAYRDLGGLVYEMHRLGQQREDLLKSKLATLQHIDSELRAIEDALREHHGVTVLREAGVTACPRCAAIHGSEDRFCPACGFSIGHNADRPIAAQPVSPPAATSTQPPLATTAQTPATPASAPAQPSTNTAHTPAAPAAAQPAAATAGQSPATLAHPPTPAPVPPPAQSSGATPPPANQRPSPSPSQSQSAPPRAPFPPPAPSQQPAREGGNDGTDNVDADKDQPTEVIEPPTQIVRPGQSHRT
jgi:hypothetical protein